MNMRILGRQRKILCVDPMRNMCFNGLMGFVCFISSGIVEKLMTIMYEVKYGKEEILL